MEVDHDRREVFSETMQILPANFDMSLMKPSDDAIAARLTNPVVTTYVDTEKISFERYAMFDKWLWIYCFNTKSTVIVICFFKVYALFL